MANPPSRLHNSAAPLIWPCSAFVLSQLSPEFSSIDRKKNRRQSQRFSNQAVLRGKPDGRYRPATVSVWIGHTKPCPRHSCSPIQLEASTSPPCATSSPRSRPAHIRQPKGFFRCPQKLFRACPDADVTRLDSRNASTITSTSSVNTTPHRLRFSQ